MSSIRLSYQTYIIGVGVSIMKFNQVKVTKLIVKISYYYYRFYNFNLVELYYMNTNPNDISLITLA